MYNLINSDISIQDILKLYYDVKYIEEIPYEINIQNKQPIIDNLDMESVISYFNVKEIYISEYSTVIYIHCDEVYKINVEKYNIRIKENGYKPLYFNAHIENYTTIPKDIVNIINDYVFPDSIYVSCRIKEFFDYYELFQEDISGYIRNMKIGFYELDKETSKHHIDKILELKQYI